LSAPRGNFVDAFGPVPHDTAERIDLERATVEGDSGHPRSPYAPGRVRERAERGLAENDCGPARVPCAQNNVRTQRELDPSPQLASPHSQEDDQPAAARSNVTIRDFKRLEASLRWIEREEATARIPRAAQLPPVPGVAPVDTRRPRHEMLELPAPPSLKREPMAPPPAMSPRHKVRVSLIIIVASIFAVLAGYYFSTEGWSPSSHFAASQQMASPIQQSNVLPSSLAQEELPQVMARDDEARDDDRGRLPHEEVSLQRPATSQPLRSSESETVAMLQPGSASEQDPASNKAVRVLDPEEIKLLMKQGEQLIAAGDVATARVVLQRAAEAGNAGAAMALGATYDPNVLAKLGVVGVKPDAEKARRWYEKAGIPSSPSPEVLIYRSANGYKVQVESTSQAVWAEGLQRPMSEGLPKSGRGGRTIRDGRAEQ
jgi:hypothetical protein